MDDHAVFVTRRLRAGDLSDSLGPMARKTATNLGALAVEDSHGVALADRILVAGHWKQQAHGPGYSLRKAIHVEPYYRGPDMAELVNKPHIVT